MAQPDDLAEAIRNAINDPARNWSLPFLAEKKEAPGFTLEELTALRVTVTDSDVDVTRASRTSDEFRYVVDVAVQQRALDDDKRVKALKALGREMLDYFRGVRFLSGCERIGLRWIVRDVAHLREHRVFTGLVSMTWREIE